MSKKEKKALDLLQKPVHVAILRPAHVQKLAQEGKLPQRLLSIPVRNIPDLPDGKPAPTEKPVASYAAAARRGAKARREVMLRTKLHVIHNNVPPLPKDQQPPCHDCKNSACCYAFMVNITAEEYESGLYGDYAVKLTHKDAENLGDGRFARIATMRTPAVHDIVEGQPQYYLEGPVGRACPMLQEDGKCGIYEKRPITCRVYTCVGDKRITEEMRNGDIDIEEALMNWMVDYRAE